MLLLHRDHRNRFNAVDMWTAVTTCMAFMQATSGLAAAGGTGGQGSRGEVSCRAACSAEGRLVWGRARAEGGSVRAHRLWEEHAHAGPLPVRSLFTDTVLPRYLAGILSDCMRTACRVKRPVLVNIRDSIACIASLCDLPRFPLPLKSLSLARSYFLCIFSSAAAALEPAVPTTRSTALLGASVLV